jgi:hypothetical protein
MPVSANPHTREFFAYQFKVDGYPFYIGIDRDTRASDRKRYVGSLMVPHHASKLTERSLGVRGDGRALAPPSPYQAHLHAWRAEI